jgi:hypothetical protein
LADPLEQRVPPDGIADPAIRCGWIKRFAFKLFENGEDLVFNFGICSGATDVFALRFRIQIAGRFAQDPSGAPLLVVQSLPSLPSTGCNKVTVQGKDSNFSIPS